MEIFKLISFIVLFPTFIIAIIIGLKFQFSAQGKDERGQHIINTSYMIAFPIFPIGWLMVTLYNDFIDIVAYDLYRWLIWILVLLAFIIHGFMIKLLSMRT